MNDKKTSMKSLFFIISKIEKLRIPELILSCLGKINRYKEIKKYEKQQRYYIKKRNEGGEIYPLW